MADEITASIVLSFAKGSKKAEMKSGSISIDMTGDDYMLQTQVIDSSQELIVISSDIGAANKGWFFARNLGVTDTISIRAGTGLEDTIDMDPGEPCCFRVHPGATLYAISSGSEPPTMEYLLIEN